MTRVQIRAGMDRRSVERHSRWLIAGVFLCFLLSGATSLILEGTLTRLLRFVLGNTSLAITTVLCAFMAGLALGSYAAGRLCGRTGRLLRIYGLMEGAVGVICLLLPACIVLFQPMYRSMYVLLADHPVALSLVRFLACGLLVLIPSTFMGATLPILTRWYALRFGRIGRSIAGLYAINSAGAGAGALLCGFMLLPGLGVTWTLRLACGVDIAICLLMLLMDRWLGPVDDMAAEPADAGHGKARTGKQDKAEDLSAAWQNGLLLAYGLSGAVALVYEVAWTRVLALVIGSTTYAFSLMLAAFIIGLAVGSAIMVRLLERVRAYLWWFGVIEVGIGVAAMAALPIFGQMPLWVVGILRHHAGSFAATQAAEFGLMLLVMMVPTTLMGAAFPLLSRAFASQSSRVGRSVGQVYSANTVGGILGAFFSTFVLIPHLGTWNTVTAAALANVAIGLVVLWALTSTGRGRGSTTAAGLAVIGGMAVLWLLPWDPKVMTSGAYLYAKDFFKDVSDDAALVQKVATNRNRKIVFLKEDMYTTVTVSDDEHVRSLAVGGKVDAGTSRQDMPTQLLLAHVPLLLHPHPRNACVIGLASGITLGAAATYDLDRLDCVEISPAVVEASHYFDEYNGRPLSDPRVRQILADGRNHLSLTSQKYDVIISEPSNPWIAGVADLFTKEFFEICRQRLAPGGKVCVWLQAYCLDETLFRSVVRTFHDTFPHMMIVEAQAQGDYMLVGSLEPIRIPYATLAGSFAAPKIAASLKRADIRQPADLLRRIVLSEDVEAYAAGGLLHTDDNALLEFGAPRWLNNIETGENIARELDRYKKVDLSFLETDPGSEAAVANLRRQLEQYVEAHALASQAVAVYARGDLPKAYELAERAAKLDPEGPMMLNQAVSPLLTEAETCRQRGDAANALALYDRAAHMAPRSREAQAELGRMLAEAGRWPELIKLYEWAASVDPEDPEPASTLAWLLATCPLENLRDARQAVAYAERACRSSQYQDVFALRALAAAYALAGRADDAVRAAEDSLKAATVSGQTNMVERLQRELAHYRQGKMNVAPGSQR